MSHSPCEDWERFHDRELEPSEQAAFVEHLPNCDDCRSRLQGLEQLEADVMAAWCLFDDESEAPPPTNGRVSLATSSDGRYFHRRLVNHVIVCVTVASVLALVIVSFNYLTQDRAEQNIVQRPSLGTGHPQANSVIDNQPSSQPLPDVLVTFTDPTDGVKVITRPTFSYVHVFPTVTRTSIQPD